MEIPRQPKAHLIQPLHVVRFYPVPGDGGVPSVAREIVDKRLQKLSELPLRVLNVDVGAPDNEVSLRGCLACSPGNRRWIPALYEIEQMNCINLTPNELYSI